MSKIQFDLILSDIHMPKMDGLTVLQKIKEEPNGRHVNVPVVIISSDTDYRQIEKARDFKAFGYIKKPFKKEGLEAAISAAKVASELRLTEEKPSAEQATNAETEKTEHSSEPVSVEAPAVPSTPEKTVEVPAKKGLFGWMKGLMGH